MVKSKYYFFLRSGRRPKLVCCSVKSDHKKTVVSWKLRNVLLTWVKTKMSMASAS